MSMDDEHIDLTRPEFWMADPYPTLARLRATRIPSTTTTRPRIPSGP